uniref:Protein kinase domain-containing protein n=1 Tax=Entomoneis paludosa TaxID=265537 RepID=A0A7S2VDT6_9STRA
MVGNKIGGRSEADLLRLVEREIRKKTKTSELLSDEVEQRITKFAWPELTVGTELGRGGFCVIRELSRITLSTDEVEEIAESGSFVNDFHNSIQGAFGWGKPQNGESDASKDQNGAQNGHHSELNVQDREYMADHCIEEVEGEDYFYPYVVKVVQDSARNQPESFVRSVIDLTLEARYLAVLQHPNIISMRATANTSPYEEGLPYFIILDKLNEILSTRLKTWRQRLPSPFFSCCFHGEMKAFWAERLQVAHAISDALAYMHSQNVVYRDIKPDNVGFDHSGLVKVFDFGLAREMQRKLRTVEGTYHLTGGTGFVPYMAPEVALDKPYNEKVDVFSFSILLWQILKVDEPFGKILTDFEFMKEVVEGGARPQPDNDWSDELVESMKLGWFEDPFKRPTMEAVTDTLQEQIDETTGSERAKLLGA